MESTFFAPSGRAGEQQLAEQHQSVADILIRSDCIDVSKYDDSFLKKSLQKRMTETYCKSLEEYFSLLEQCENERLLFIDSLHISYSEFFRNPLTFAVLERIIGYNCCERFYRQLEVVRSKNH